MTKPKPDAVDRLIAELKKYETHAWVLGKWVPAGDLRLSLYSLERIIRRVLPKRAKRRTAK
jgi:hypothetical protein